MAKYVAAICLTAEQMLAGYGRIATGVTARKLDKRVSRDVDDDAVLACAPAARADLVLDATARRVATRGVMVQKSAAAIVVFRYFTKVADHEGPNMRSRTEQWAARYSTMKPDRASRVRRRSKMPVLYAFCA